MLKFMFTNVHKYAIHELQQWRFLCCKNVLDLSLSLSLSLSLVYCILRHTFPKAAIRFHRVPRRRPLHHAAHQDTPREGVVSDPDRTPVPPPPLSQAAKQQRKDKRKGRPMAGRKNKEAREKAIEDHRAVSGHVMCV